MSLLSLKDDGKLYYEGVEDSFVEELAYELDEKVENVEITISYLIKHNMLEESNSEELYMNRITEMTGTETDSAKRKRRQRLRENSDILLPKRDNVQISHTEKEEEIEKKKETQINIEDFFESVWKLYPLLKGKGRISISKKKTFVKYSLDEWTTIIDRYNNSVKDKAFLMHGSTFFNGGYIDFLDENFMIDPINQPKEYDREPRNKEEEQYFRYLKEKTEHPDRWDDSFERDLLIRKAAMEKSLNELK